MSTVAPSAQASAFDLSQYDLPIPKKDGHKADVLRLQFGGAIDLDLYNNDALEFLNGLKLGQERDLTVTVRVNGSAWRHGFKGEEHEDQVVHQIGMKVTSITIPKSDS